MNNKGFAITSVVYGLSILGIMVVMILMGTLSATRNNVSEEAKRVEEFLIAFNQTEVSYRSTGNYTYNVPMGETGWYRIEAFGGNACSGGSGRGAYTTGIIYLTEDDSLDLTVGGCNNASTIKMTGSTDVIMRAAGGNGSAPGGTLMCYDSEALGGFVDVSSFKIKAGENMTGTMGVTFSNCTNTSYIRGYPGSGAGTWDYYFVDGLMLAGANSSSSGKILIERLAERDDLISTIPRKNTKFDGVSNITITTSHVIEAVYYSYHNDYEGTGFKGHVVKCGNAKNCDVKGTGNTKNIDDVSIIFASTEYKNSLDDVVVKFDSNIVYDSTGTKGLNGGPTGIHLSAYQPDSYDADKSDWVDNFAPHGNYYIIPVVSENKVISAALNAADDADKLKIEYFTGESRQRWAIDLINTPDDSVRVFTNIGNKSARKEYRIMELTRYKAMNIYYDENYRLNFISAPETFNSLSRNEPQIWNIYPMSDGTYAIKTVVESFDVATKTGFLFAKTRGESVNNIDDIMIGLTANNPDNEWESLPTQVERFFLYSLDFSSN